MEGFNLTYLVLAVFLAVEAAIAVWAIRKGLRLQAHAERLLHSGATARGTVVESTIPPSSSRGTDAPARNETIEFQDGMGNVVRGTTSLHPIATEDRTGQTVAVHFDRDDPHAFIAPVEGRPYPSRQLARPFFLIGGSCVITAIAVLVIGLVII